LEEETPQPALVVERPDDATLAVRLSGSWITGARLPAVQDVLGQAEEGVRRITFDTSAVSDWDTGFLPFLVGVIRGGEAASIEAERDGLPEGVQRLLDLAFAVAEKETGRAAGPRSLVARIGQTALDGWREALAFVTFLGEATLSIGRLLTGRARFRRSDLALTIQECGSSALGIVSLISFLIGLILAFVGAVQLKLFGAEIYVADLVAIAMAREMGAIMTGIVMAGRTGAAFAAQLGTMTVNEEIDALETMGFDPMDFLVLPRMLALILMMPLLTIYSNLLGILGGVVVGVGMLGITPELYWNQTVGSVDLTQFTIGIVKGSVFGVLVAVAGCLRGIQSGRSASAVGLAATSAVVTGIVAIIVTDAIFAVLLEAMGI